MVEEINKIGHNNFYLSGIMMSNDPIKLHCGNDLNEFDENKLLKISKR